MPILLLPDGQLRPCSLAAAPPGVDPAEHARAMLDLTLSALPEGTRALPVDAPPPELAGLPPECWAWDEASGALVLGGDLSAGWAQVRQRRDQLLADSDWRMARAREHAEAGRPKGEGELRAVLLWRQALRDLPARGGDPRRVVWPVAPWEGADAAP